MDIEFLIISSIASFIACFFSSLAGGGAGLILLPILILLNLPYVNALSSHKLAVGFIGVGSSIKYFQAGLVNKKVFWVTSLVGLPFVILGTKFSAVVSGEVMKPVIGVIVILIVILSFLKKKKSLEHNPKINNKNLIIMSILLIPMAFYSGWISSASGVFTTLIFIHILGFDQLNATAATLTANGLFWNGAGAIAHIFMSHIVWELAPGLIIGAIAGSYLGASMGIKKGNKFIRFFFLNSALITGIVLLLKN